MLLTVSHSNRRPPDQGDLLAWALLSFCPSLCLLQANRFCSLDQVHACSAAKINISSSVQSISSKRMAQRACSYIWFIRTASYCSRKRTTLVIDGNQGTDSRSAAANLTIDDLTDDLTLDWSHKSCFLLLPNFCPAVCSHPSLIQARMTAIAQWLADPTEN